MIEVGRHQLTGRFDESRIPPDRFPCSWKSTALRSRLGKNEPLMGRAQPVVVCVGKVAYTEPIAAPGRVSMATSTHLERLPGGGSECVRSKKQPLVTVPFELGLDAVPEH